MTKWIKEIIFFVILLFFIWYLSKNWQDIEVLLKLGSVNLSVYYVLLFLQTLTSSCLMVNVLRALKIKANLKDILILQNSCVLLNYLPMRIGTFFRANYLKRKYGLLYAHFGVFFMYLTFLMVMTASLVGSIFLYFGYGYGSYENKILALVFAVSCLGSAVLLFLPITLPQGEGKVKAHLRNFLNGRREVTQNVNVLLVSVLFLTLNFLINAVRLWILFQNTGYQIGAGGYIILGAVGFVIMFVGIMPGGLGIRELALAASATVVNVPMGVGGNVAVAGRAIMLSYVFTIGVFCTVWLWRKYPEDFRKIKTPIDDMKEGKGKKIK
jgi:uncharacterized membrane protein YbhN (UPF0104 family)